MKPDIVISGAHDDDTTLVYAQAGPRDGVILRVPNSQVADYPNSWQSAETRRKKRRK